ncbi:MAG: hypothetical protein ABW321_35650 [Polyangiales bacterium]
MTKTQCVVDGMMCNNVGAGTGTLLCNATTCTFNFGMCSSMPSGGGGSGGTGR